MPALCLSWANIGLPDTDSLLLSAQEGEEIGLPIWPGMGADGLADEDAMPVMPRWLNVNLPRMNGAAGASGIGRIIGAPGAARIGVGELGGPRQAVEVGHASIH